MARHETKTVYHTCDMCGVKCDPLPYFGVGLRYHMDLVSTVQFKVSWQFGFTLADLVCTMLNDARTHCADDVVTCATWDNGVGQ